MLDALPLLPIGSMPRQLAKNNLDKLFLGLDLYWLLKLCAVALTFRPARACCWSAGSVNRWRHFCVNYYQGATDSAAMAHNQQQIYQVGM